jgi:UDP:flavonoid glycosyltransferase YjiC (YdhE family)
MSVARGAGGGSASTATEPSGRPRIGSSPRTSKRIVLATWGSYGDLFPYLGLAIGLKARGADVVLASCPYYKPIVEREGIEFRPLRPDVDPAATDLIRRIMDPRRGSEVIVREVLMSALAESYADAVDAARGADLLVSHPITFTIPIVAEVLRLPWLSSVLSPLSFFSVSDFPVLATAAAARLVRMGAPVGRLARAIAMRMTAPWTAPVQALRRSLGLPVAPNVLFDGQFSASGTLALFSRVLADPQPDWPVRTTVTGFVPYNGPERELSAELAAFLDRGDPPIVFTLGSSAVGAAGTFYQESARAAALAGWRAVLLVGPRAENRPADLMPPGVLLQEYAPHEQLFPRAAAIVHHGGVGTTSQALRSGRPMLVVPFAHDQPDNAYRVSRLGVARVVPPSRYRARRVASELGLLLDSRTTIGRAAEIGRTVGAERAIDPACDAILAVSRPS